MSVKESSLCAVGFECDTCRDIFKRPLEIHLKDLAKYYETEEGTVNTRIYGIENIAFLVHATEESGHVENYVPFIINERTPFDHLYRIKNKVYCFDISLKEGRIHKRIKETILEHNDMLIWLALGIGLPVLESAPSMGAPYTYPTEPAPERIEVLMPDMDRSLPCIISLHAGYELHFPSPASDSVKVALMVGLMSQSCEFDIPKDVWNGMNIYTSSSECPRCTPAIAEISRDQVYVEEEGGQDASVMLTTTAMDASYHPPPTSHGPIAGVIAGTQAVPWMVEAMSTFQLKEEFNFPSSAVTGDVLWEWEPTYGQLNLPMDYLMAPAMDFHGCVDVKFTCIHQPLSTGLLGIIVCPAYEEVDSRTIGMRKPQEFHLESMECLEITLAPRLNVLYAGKGTKFGQKAVVVALSPIKANSSAVVNATIRVETKPSMSPGSALTFVGWDPAVFLPATSGGTGALGSVEILSSNTTIGGGYVPTVMRTSTKNPTLFTPEQRYKQKSALALLAPLLWEGLPNQTLAASTYSTFADFDQKPAYFTGSDSATTERVPGAIIASLGMKGIQALITARSALDGNVALANWVGNQNTSSDNSYVTQWLYFPGMYLKGLDATTQTLDNHTSALQYASEGFMVTGDQTNHSDDNGSHICNFMVSPSMAVVLDKSVSPTVTRVTSEFARDPTDTTTKYTLHSPVDRNVAVMNPNRTTFSCSAYINVYEDGTILPSTNFTLAAPIQKMKKNSTSLAFDSDIVFDNNNTDSSFQISVDSDLPVLVQSDSASYITGKTNETYVQMLNFHDLPVATIVDQFMAIEYDGPDLNDLFCDVYSELNSEYLLTMRITHSPYFTMSVPTMEFDIAFPQDLIFKNFRVVTKNQALPQRKGAIYPWLSYHSLRKKIPMSSSRVGKFAKDKLKEAMEELSVSQAALAGLGAGLSGLSHWMMFDKILQLETRKMELGASLPVYLQNDQQDFMKEMFVLKNEIMLNNQRLLYENYGVTPASTRNPSSSPEYYSSRNVVPGPSPFRTGYHNDAAIHSSFVPGGYLSDSRGSKNATTQTSREGPIMANMSTQTDGGAPRQQREVNIAPIKPEKPDAAPLASLSPWIVNEGNNSGTPAAASLNPESPSFVPAGEKERETIKSEGAVVEHKTPVAVNTSSTGTIPKDPERTTLKSKRTTPLKVITPRVPSSDWGAIAAIADGTDMNAAATKAKPAKVSEAVPVRKGYGNGRPLQRSSGTQTAPSPLSPFPRQNALRRKANSRYRPTSARIL